MLLINITSTFTRLTNHFFLLFIAINPVAGPCLGNLYPSSYPWADSDTDRQTGTSFFSISVHSAWYGLCELHVYHEE